MPAPSSPSPLPAASATPTPRRLSISVIVALIVVLPIIAVSAALLALAWAASARVSENLGSHVMTAAAGSVAAKIDSFLGEATRVSDRYAQRIASGTLPPSDPSLGFQPWERTMFDDLSTTPAIASICYGNTRGDATWLLRGESRLEIGRVDGARAGHALEFTVDPATGAAVGDPLRVYTYYPRQRPWWSVAMSSPTPMWTPVYTWFTGNTADTTIGTGYTRQIHAPDGALRGCLVIDVTLGALNDFLRQLDVAETGYVFIIDPDDRLIAASAGAISDKDGARYLVASAPQPEAFAVAAAMSQAKRTRSDPSTLNVTINGEPARATVTPLAAYPGITWRLVTVLPESAFMAEAHAVRTRAIIAAIVAVLASLLFGLLLSRRLSAPVVQITEHVKRVGAGDFDARLNLAGAQELVVLSQEINRMAAGLKDRMQLQHSLAVAMEVQQSLLPASDPTHSRLDAAGHSKYCDQTGGDYYDFIDVAPITPDCMLIAVGDVMGHGIAAALWMATARAAIRTEALGGAGLARLMTRTNRVLSLNNRHHRFMTLSLVRIDAAPPRRSVTWASAGHDPPLCYDPATDTFVELEGGDVPLGVMDDVEYQEYTRENLPAGAVIAIGTDGVWEMSDGKDRYGKDRLMAVLREN
ncbi:MAG: SpoIIE family protein phosphatase, partial [Phycisphaerales bacterium]